MDTEAFLVPPNREAFRSEFGLSDTDIVIAAVAQLISRKERAQRLVERFLNEKVS